MRSRALPAAALQGLVCLTLSGCHSVFGLDDYELVTEGSGAAGGLGSGASGTGGGSNGGDGMGARGGSGGEAVALDDCCIDDAGPPEGWTYAIVSRDTGDVGNPQCLGSGADPLVLLSGEPGSAICEGCACGSPEGASCAQNLTCYANANCSGNAATFTNTSCNVLLLSKSCRLTPIATDGTCEDSVSSVTLPPWDYKHFACPEPADPPTTDAVQCDPGQHCAVGPPGAQVCIWQQGLSQCPLEGDFTEAVQVFEESSIVDGRSCGGCDCGPAPTTCSGGSFKYGALIACDTVQSSTTCTPTGDIVRAGIESAATPTTQDCVPTGSPIAQGGIDQKDDYTLCCRGAFE